MKKIIVLQHNEGQLANQLWLFSHLLAYALEKNYDIDIWCFYQYDKFFDTPFPKNKFIKFIFYKTFPTFVFKNKNLFRLFKKIYRIVYRILVILTIEIFYKKNIIDSSKKQYILDNDSKKDEIIKKFESDPNFNLIFTLDWNFLAYSYLEKHREKIKEIFKPRKDLEFQIKNYIQEIRKNFDYIIGLHLRFKEPGDGDFYDPEFFWYVENKDLEYINDLIKEIIKEKNLDINKTAILIASNAKELDIKKFKELNVFYEKRNLVVDLFLLSECDIILGTKSSFSAFTSYIGNIPIIFLYKDKNKILERLGSKDLKFYLWKQN
jgi:organic radical activating enzyme